MRKDLFKGLLGSLLSLSDEQLDLLLSAAHERRQMNQGTQALESSRAGLGLPPLRSSKHCQERAQRWLAALLLPLLRQVLQRRHQHRLVATAEQGALLSNG